MEDDLDKFLQFIDLECLEGYVDALNEVYFNKDKAKSALKKLLNDARLTVELFVPVRGYEGLYEVSNLGAVRSIARGRNTGKILRQNTRTNIADYQCVQMSKDNIRKSFYVHRILAENFISNPENKRTVNHKDGNPRNNSLNNLEWATHSEQERHAYAVLGKINSNNPARLELLKRKGKG